MRERRQLRLARGLRHHRRALWLGAACGGLRTRRLVALARQLGNRLEHFGLRRERRRICHGHRPQRCIFARLGRRREPRGTPHGAPDRAGNRRGHGRDRRGALHDARGGIARRRGVFRARFGDRRVGCDVGDVLAVVLALVAHLEVRQRRDARAEADVAHIAQRVVGVARQILVVQRAAPPGAADIVLLRGLRRKALLCVLRERLARRSTCGKVVHGALVVVAIGRDTARLRQTPILFAVQLGDCVVDIGHRRAHHARIIGSRAGRRSRRRSRGTRRAEHGSRTALRLGTRRFGIVRRPRVGGRGARTRLLRGSARRSAIEHFLCRSAVIGRVRKRKEARLPTHVGALEPAVAVRVVLLHDCDLLADLEAHFVRVFCLKVIQCIDIFSRIRGHRAKQSTVVAAATRGVC